MMIGTVLERFCEPPLPMIVKIYVTDLGPKLSYVMLVPIKLLTVGFGPFDSAVPLVGYCIVPLSSVYVL